MIFNDTFAESKLCGVNLEFESLVFDIPLKGFGVLAVFGFELATECFSGLDVLFDSTNLSSGTGEGSHNLTRGGRHPLGFFCMGTVGLVGMIGPVRVISLSNNSD